jgi:hypothetical protein
MAELLTQSERLTAADADARLRVGELAQRLSPGGAARMDGDGHGRWTRTADTDGDDERCPAHPPAPPFPSRSACPPRLPSTG